MKKVILGALAVCCAMVGASAFAAVVSGGVGGVANQVITNMSSIAKLITASSYVAGMAFGVGAIVKFKAHKDNPTQIPIGQPIALFFVAIALIFIPTIYKVGGSTLLGTSGVTGGPSGVAKYGIPTAS